MLKHPSDYIIYKGPTFSVEWYYTEDYLGRIKEGTYYAEE